MLDLQALVRLLHPTQLLELGGYFFLDSYTFGHDYTLARLFAPTRQRERMDVKRRGNITHRDARQLAQTDSGCLEIFGVAIGRSWAWFRHGVDSLSGSSGCPLKRRNCPGRLDEVLDGCDAAARAPTTATKNAPLEQPTTPKLPALNVQACDDAAREAAAATDDKPA